ncbi:MAG: hypothetical protein QF689_00535 [Candidatus Latescibacteria bacterium]|nr:hypothetical protein [Gemmatimonadaceae bacterium]MDP6017360.1 hypothetical protein [Candidatus Latescibacterota bacterium]MDP7447046.1 hypothetical protein [Candidatus Latescibacterota bacterium]HJP30273.1 hypothetical protein [Candidatus Latescibacterota bacterium]
MNVGSRLPLALPLCLVACIGGEPTAPHQSPQSLETNVQRPRQLEVLDAVVVQGRTGAGGAPFQSTRRTGRIAQFPCHSCHDHAVVEPTTSDVSGRWSHLDIRLEHAEALRCGTCHDYDDLNQLHLIHGDPVDFDQSYQLCAQCHAPQARDWAGGAHGKRLGGWRGDRVVETCTGCHDPHAPAFPRRMPRMYPQVPRTGTDR